MPLYNTITFENNKIFIICDNNNKICFHAKQICLSLKYKDETLIDGNFEVGEGVKTGESIWTLNVSDNQSSCQVVITLDKTRSTWWKHVIDGHPEIDTTKVDSSSKIGDYDESTQGAIRKILHDQRQKSLGLPTSDELAQQELLEKYKYCPGSPFLEETK